MKVTDWNCVDKILPKDGDTVLIYVENEKTYWVEVATFVYQKSKYPSWLTGEGCYLYDKVKYWMPIIYPNIIRSK